MADHIDVIRGWHVDGRGWSDIGYHYCVSKKSGIQIGRPIGKPGAHCRGQNSNSIGVCVLGNKIFTPAQLNDTYKLLLNLIDIFDLDENAVYPHNYFNSVKSCPNIDLTPFKQLLAVRARGLSLP